MLCKPGSFRNNGDDNDSDDSKIAFIDFFLEPSIIFRACMQYLI